MEIKFFFLLLISHQSASHAVKDCPLGQPACWRIASLTAIVTQSDYNSTATEKVLVCTYSILPYKFYKK